MENFSLLQSELVSHIKSRTGSRLRQLDVTLSPDRVVLHGVAPSYHVKQLAQHGVREVLPDVRLDNAIVVTV